MLVQRNIACVAYSKITILQNLENTNKCVLIAMFWVHTIHWVRIGIITSTQIMRWKPTMLYRAIVLGHTRFTNWTTIFYSLPKTINIGWPQLRQLWANDIRFGIGALVDGSACILCAECTSDLVWCNVYFIPTQRLVGQSMHLTQVQPQALMHLSVTLMNYVYVYI